MVAPSPHMAFYSGTQQHKKWSDLKIVHHECHTLTDPDAKPIFLCLFLPVHVRWVPCHHSMVHPQVVDGADGI
jgi:hypothetical protein